MLIVHTSKPIVKILRHQAVRIKKFDKMIKAQMVLPFKQVVAKAVLALDFASSGKQEHV